MNVFKLRLISWMEKSSNSLDKTHQEDPLSQADSKLICQGEDLSWKTCWFLSNQRSDNRAFTAVKYRKYSPIKFSNFYVFQFYLLCKMFSFFYFMTVIHFSLYNSFPLYIEGCVFV